MINFYTNLWLHEERSNVFVMGEMIVRKDFVTFELDSVFVKKENDGWLKVTKDILGSERRTKILIDRLMNQYERDRLCLVEKSKS